MKGKFSIVAVGFRREKLGVVTERLERASHILQLELTGHLTQVDIILFWQT